VKSYQEFLATKDFDYHGEGMDVGKEDLSRVLYPFQRDITSWSLAKGKSAVFADCGLGKTLIQLEWAQKVAGSTGRDVIIFAPLAVNRQTVEEGHKLGVVVHPVRSQEQVKPGVNIANYEMLDHFDPRRFGGLVLDESSILKHFGSVYRGKLTEFALPINFRLCCTATPAPNDYVELINHAEFLSIMSGREVLALFFTNAGGETQSWRLKKHAKDDFWLWVASWEVVMRAGVSERYDNMDGWISQEDWIEWAAPVWYRKIPEYPGGISETDVLNAKMARAKDDERHICPLQLGVIHRAVYLWSAPGETVFSPFAGIGSEGYQALLDGRKFVGIELKREYYDVAIRNLNRALQERQKQDLFAEEVGT